MTTRLDDEQAVAVLLIDAGIGCDPEAPVEGALPIYAGGTGAGGTPRINVKQTGSDDEPRNHTGRQLSRPVVEIEMHCATRQDAWDRGMLLQQFCDNPEARNAVKGDAELMVTTIARTSAIKQLGEHPKTKLYVAGVSVILSVPSIDPATT